MQQKYATTVYSTEQGAMCPRCGKPVSGCICAQKKCLVPGGDRIVRISRETKGRKGKGVTIVSGIPLPPAELQALAKEFKQKCGTGGTIKQGVLEIQGDHRDLLMRELAARGFTVKRCGG
ncbi:MAG: translation initiation factor Sui1 [Desulfoplanes sp.]|nr:translation initiation factor Sui1 [Desulfoplanes sp.]